MELLVLLLILLMILVVVLDRLLDVRGEFIRMEELDETLGESVGGGCCWMRGLGGVWNRMARGKRLLLEDDEEDEENIFPNIV